MHIGIDIGRYGAIAVIDEKGKFLEVNDMPIEELINGKTKQLRVKSDQLSKMFGRILMQHDGKNLAVMNLRERVSTIWVEQVWARPGEGFKNSFLFGRLLGGVEAVLGANEMPFGLVSPQRWKKYYGLLGKEKTKEDSLTMARAYFPDAPLSRKKDHGRAEALLLARYGLEYTPGRE